MTPRNRVGSMLFATGLFLSCQGSQTGSGAAKAPLDSTAAPPQNAASEAVAKASFAQLVSLAGEWQGTGGSPNPKDPARASFIVTAKGSAVLERIIIQDPVEMVSMYFIRDGGLAMQHYCAAGNQPLMLLTREAKPTTMSFAFIGGTSLVPERDTYMHGRETIVFNPDSIAMVWETHSGGRFVSKDTLYLHRRRGKKV